MPLRSMTARATPALRLLPAILCASVPAGAFAADYSVLHSFSWYDSGGIRPMSGVIADGDTLYGTTWGDASSYANSTVFRLNTDGTNFHTLHSFANTPADGMNAYGGLALDGQTLYGTTQNGGAAGHGTIFTIATDGTGFSLLHSFAGGPSDGNEPMAGLVHAGSALYGTTALGGPGGWGTVFRIAPDGTGFTTLHTANFNSPENMPMAPVTVGETTLYGASEGDGGNNNWGGIYSVNSDGSGFTLLHRFTSTGADGVQPRGALVLSGSTLYGTTFGGGGTGSYGTVFSINTDGSGYRVLHSFASPGPANPISTLAVVGSTLYGTTQSGGANGAGTLFRLNEDGSGFQILHDFGGNYDGQIPVGPLTLNDSATALYGTTANGGAYGSGTVFSFAIPEPATALLFVPALALLRRARRAA